MRATSLTAPQMLLHATNGSLGEFPSFGDYHRNLLDGLRTFIGCDGALFRPGSSWDGAQAYYLEEDARFTDDYVKQADRFRSEVKTWCRLTKGHRAVIDTELYSSAERRKKALYGEVIAPAGVKSILGCPLSVNGNNFGLIFLYRTGIARPFRADLARALDPVLKGLALAEMALATQESKEQLGQADGLPRKLRPVFESLLAGRREKEIAVRLCLSPRTVHKYTEQIYRYYSVHSRAQLLACTLTQPGSHKAFREPTL